MPGRRSRNHVKAFSVFPTLRFVSALCPLRSSSAKTGFRAMEGGRKKQKKQKKTFSDKWAASSAHNALAPLWNPVILLLIIHLVGTHLQI